MTAVRPTRFGGRRIIVATVDGTIDPADIALALSNLIDVDLTGLADGDTLVWDAGSGTWVTVDVATQAEVDAHLTDASDAHDASAISFNPTGTIAATDVQAAIAEVASEAGLTVKDEGSALATTATSIDFVGAGVTASGTGAAKTITIPGGATSASDVSIWRPLMDPATGMVITDGTTGEAVMGFGPA